MTGKTKRLSTRKILEFVGLLLLVFSIYTGRTVLSRAFHEIRSSDPLPLIACFAMVWTNFLWSAMGYKILLNKYIPLWHIYLAHLAASGPGRVVPGGGGHMSFGTLFLQKNGLRVPASLAISITNNAIGFSVNLIVLLVVFIANPALLHRLHVTGMAAGLGMLSVAAVVALYYFLKHRFSGVRTGSRVLHKEFVKLRQRLMSQPKRLIGLLLLSLTTLTVNSAILYFAAAAVHMHLSPLHALIALSTGVALGSLIPTPGGIGGVEAGIVATMYALGLNLELATSTALLFRAATYVQPLIPGLLAYLWLRQKKLI